MVKRVIEWMTERGRKEKRREGKREREREREEQRLKEDTKSYQEKKDCWLGWTTVFVLLSRTSKRRGYTFPSIKPMDPAQLSYNLKSVPRILNQDEREGIWFCLNRLNPFRGSRLQPNTTKGSSKRTKFVRGWRKKNEKQLQVNSWGRRGRGWGFFLRTVEVAKMWAAEAAAAGAEGAERNVLDRVQRCDVEQKL